MSQQQKIYLMAVAATGKSRFSSIYPSYRGYKVVDFADRMPKPSLLVKVLVYLGRRFRTVGMLARNSEFVRAKKHGHYYESIFKFLRESEGPTIVLGRPGPQDLSRYADIKFGAVLIPWEQHQKNCEFRRESLRNPFPSFNHWSTGAATIKDLRSNLENYAQHHQIPVYGSFEDAADDLIAERAAGG